MDTTLASLLGVVLGAFITLVGQALRDKRKEKREREEALRDRYADWFHAQTVAFRDARAAFELEERAKKSEGGMEETAEGPDWVSSLQPEVDEIWKQVEELRREMERAQFRILVVEQDEKRRGQVRGATALPILRTDPSDGIRSVNKKQTEAQALLREIAGKDSLA